MGRIAAYLGPSVSPAALLEGGSYSLARQAAEYPDGFGLGWFPLDQRPEPVRIASRMPIWTDQHLLDVPRRYRAECAVAEVRRAELAPAELSGVQPFVSSSFLFAHDGALDRFDEVFRRPLAERLSDVGFAAAVGGTPSELLFATWLDALGESTGADAMAGALEAMVQTVTEIAMKANASAAFGVVVTDGHSLLTLRTATQGPPPPLYTIVAEDDAVVPTTGRVVASEPLFPGAWSALDPNSLVIFTVTDEAQLTEPAAMRS